MADLIGRQVAITCTAISSPTLGHVVRETFARHAHDGTRFGDFHDRVTPGTGYGSIFVRCFVDSGTTPALAEVQTGTGVVVTVQLDGTSAHQYVTTNGIFIRMEHGAQSVGGSPPQYVEYEIAISTVTAGVQPVIKTG